MKKIELYDEVILKDGRKAAIVEIFPESYVADIELDDGEYEMDVWIVIIAVIVSLFALYLPVSYVFKPDMQKLGQSLLVVAGIFVVLFAYVLIVIFADSKVATMSIALAVASLAAYLPLSYMFGKG